MTSEQQQHQNAYQAALRQNNQEVVALCSCRCLPKWKLLRILLKKPKLHKSHYEDAREYLPPAEDDENGELSARRDTLSRKVSFHSKHDKPPQPGTMMGDSSETDDALGISLSMSAHSDISAKSTSDDSCFFFDAEEIPLEEDDFPPIIEDPIAVKMIHKKKLRDERHAIKLEQKLERLAARKAARKAEKEATIAEEKKDVEEEDTAAPTPPRPAAAATTDARMNYAQREPSERFHSLITRSHEEVMESIKHPRVTLDGNGYPGTLTESQLQECQKFLDLLPTLDPSVAEQIYSFRDVEDPAFTICRWLRATKWDAASILKRCAENQPLFDQAQLHQWYPDPSISIGAPFPIFLSQYPFLPIGKGKNGCPVNYFQGKPTCAT